MPKENRFAGLGEAIEDEGEEVATDSEQETDETPTAEPSKNADEKPGKETNEGVDEGADNEATEESASSASNSSDSKSVTSEDSKDNGASDDGGPAFEFEATTAKSVYVRQKTLDLMDDAEFEVESHLRREHGIRDLTGREFHDALIRVAAEYPEEIVDVILETRDD
ncbi:hypothetical protein ACH9L7_17175 (plasmid) [Haloferax sp. S1W]|uniref:hypothetical protein n=1 Tax=Haloferax sp. S1W TaxID=3377110 RepID=UPI0037C74520